MEFYELWGDFCLNGVWIWQRSIFSVSKPFYCEWFSVEFFSFKWFSEGDFWTQIEHGKLKKEESTCYSIWFIGFGGKLRSLLRKGTFDWYDEGFVTCVKLLNNRQKLFNKFSAWFLASLSKILIRNSLINFKHTINHVSSTKVGSNSL